MQTQALTQIVTLNKPYPNLNTNPNINHHPNQNPNLIPGNDGSRRE